MGDIGPDDVPERDQGEEEEQEQEFGEGEGFELEGREEEEEEPGGEEVPPVTPPAEEAAAEEPPRPPGPDIGDYLGTAWDLVIHNAVLAIVGFLVVWAITAFSSILIVGPLLLGGPLLFGYLRVLQKRLDGEPAEFGEIFGGFQDFGKALATYLLVALVAIGISVLITLAIVLLCLIPCAGWVLAVLLAVGAQIIITAALFFVFPIAALSNVPATESIGRSIRFCIRNFGHMLLLALVTSLIAAAGSLACGVGGILTVPIALAMMVVAYNRWYLPAAEQGV
jgi:hypothetical protein